MKSKTGQILKAHDWEGLPQRVRADGTMMPKIRRCRKCGQVFSKHVQQMGDHMVYSSIWYTPENCDEAVIKAVLES